MIRLALVGGIGSGKTFISKLFGYPVFNADDTVTKIYFNNKKVLQNKKNYLNFLLIRLLKRSINKSYYKK